MKNKLLFLAFLLNGMNSFCQINGYEYKREISGIKGQWNAIELPDQVYSKVSTDLSDIRVYGITSKNDTIEAPYLLSKNEVNQSSTAADFKLINESKNGKAYYFTFLGNEKVIINQINLNFKQRNYDWRIKLEGSLDQHAWFTIAENYRILSIKNDLTNYQFNKIAFPDSKYKYYRIGIVANEKPELLSTNMSFQKERHGILKNDAIKRIQITQDKKRKQTIVDIELKMQVPVCKLKIGVKDNLDYYRPVQIEYLTDSFKTEKSWYFNYGPAQDGITLSSIDKKDFEFKSCITNKLRITIDNQDNQPLTINKFEILGYKNILITRIQVPARYYLCYGRKSSMKPNYDLEQFSYKISDLANQTTLGKEEFVNPTKSGVTEPLFSNKVWLWGIMSLIILMLGWSTLKMMKKKE
ncbi:MAG: DUF3999 family protein [Paludibacter sp.]|nr:DUF3999 family protein [Paludibacter sp.]